MTSEGHHMKLNIGCGSQKFRGYVNIDSREEVAPDLCVDYLTLEKYFEPNSVTEIIAIHSLYTLTYGELVAYLKSLRNILAPGGLLIIESPDLQKVIRRIVAGQAFAVETSLEQYTELVRPLIGIGLDECWGAAENQRNGHLVHCQLISNLLVCAGFENIFSEPPRYHYRDRDYRVIAEKPRLGISRGKILCIANKTAPASTNVRCKAQIDGMRSLGWKMDVIYYDDLPNLLRDKDSLLFEYDIFYCLKTNDSSVIINLKNYVKLGQKIVYDVVDSLWNNAHYGVTQTVSIFNTADFIFCENPYLQFQTENLSGKNSNIFHVRGGIDTIYIERALLQKTRSPIIANKRVVVGWSGSTYTLPGLLRIYKAIESLGRTMGSRKILLRIILMGEPQTLDLPEIDGVETEVVYYGFDERVLASMLVELDIGLYPKPYDEDEFLGRGYGKGYLYMAAGVPSIWSESSGNRTNDAFTPSLLQGEEFLVAEDIPSWERSIFSLIVNHDLREKISRNGREAASKLFSRARSLHSLDSAFLSVLGAGVYSNELR